MTTCLVISNPGSRRSLSDARLAGALAVARDAGWKVSEVRTEREGHATDLAITAAGNGVDVLVVNGGDGTINEVINGIAGTPVALAALRGGTANVWAGEIGMERDPVKAMRQIVGGERRRVDLGRANGRCFLLMAGVGFDGEIVPDVGGWRKRLLGPFAYIVAGVIAAFRTKAVASIVRIDGEQRDMSVFWMIAGNTRSYGGFVDILHRAQVDDGLLDVAIMHRGGPWRMIVDGVRVLRKRHEQSDNIEYLKAHTIEIDTPGLPVQLDGERCGKTPMRFELWPKALSVVVPSGLTTPLFATDAGAPGANDWRL